MSTRVESGIGNRESGVGSGATRGEFNSTTVSAPRESGIGSGATRGEFNSTTVSAPRESGIGNRESGIGGREVRGIFRLI
ncbi:MAG: hypothetical protein F6K55_25635 [Moorea sp. SIO4A3]|nr:hypothetical protein [Moorena sp. SIO4A3]